MDNPTPRLTLTHYLLGVLILIMALLSGALLIASAQLSDHRVAEATARQLEATIREAQPRQPAQSYADTARRMPF